MVTIPDEYTLIRPSQGLTLVVRRELKANFVREGLNIFPEQGKARPGSVVVEAVHGRGTVQRFNSSVAGDLVLKWYRHGGLLGGLFGYRYLGKRRALRELQAAVTAQRAGVPLAPIAAIWIERRGGPFIRMAMATKAIDGSQDLFTFLNNTWQAHSSNRDPRADVLRHTAEALRRLHDSGIVHGDLNLGNILVFQGEHGPRVCLIDFDGARSTGEPLDRRRRETALSRMKRSLWKMSGDEPAPLHQSEERYFLTYYWRNIEKDRGFPAGPLQNGDSATTCRRCRRELAFHRFWWKITGLGGRSSSESPDDTGG